eukprot:5282781-Pleurochrysis_carterae.AAC.1
MKATAPNSRRGQTGSARTADARARSAAHRACATACGHLRGLPGPLRRRVHTDGKARTATRAH